VQSFEIEHARPHDAYDRQAYAFLKDRTRATRNRARHRTANVRMMTDIGGEEFDPAVYKHRRHAADIRQVRAVREIRVVAQEDVAVLNLVERTRIKHGLD